MSMSIQEKLNQRLAQNMAAHNASHGPASPGVKEHLQIQLDQIDPNPFQPRREFNQESLDNLAASIQANGLVSPIEVRRNGPRYQIVHGERRFRAHQALGRVSIEALLVAIDDKAMRAQALIENLQREDLSDFDVALAIDAMKGDYESISAMAAGLGVGREDVYRYLSFFDLPEAAVDFLHANHDVLGRAASYALKSILAEHAASTEVEAIVVAALEKIAAGELSQRDAVAKIEAALRPVTAKKVTAEKKVLSCGKTRLGTFEAANGRLVLKLKEAALTEGQRAKLDAFVASLSDGE